MFLRFSVVKDVLLSSRCKPNPTRLFDLEVAAPITFSDIPILGDGLNSEVCLWMVLGGFVFWKSLQQFIFTSKFSLISSFFMSDNLYLNFKEKLESFYRTIGLLLFLLLLLLFVSNSFIAKESWDFIRKRPRVSSFSSSEERLFFNFYSYLLIVSWPCPKVMERSVLLAFPKLPVIDRFIPGFEERYSLS